MIFLFSGFIFHVVFEYIIKGSDIIGEKYRIQSTYEKLYRGRYYIQKQNHCTKMRVCDVLPKKRGTA
ncbi:hypothetical protein C5749_04450 [Sphingobacterium gobiense]|uniref:Uncharacterized protein n=1 Tax=Sphingobacterium gobiense TaxID=1382456 RepID=A0A2S9JT87_9SPHI|nr:hypothetical protein C5749_04450 [Sphingobacterium gobiense]